MKLVTIQASAIKSTFEVLKDILNDVNVYFRPSGMYIVTLDTARTSLIDMFLSADNFEEYHCEHDEIIAGINISNTFKLLKTITNNDVLKIEINSKEYMSKSTEFADKGKENENNKEKQYLADNQNIEYQGTSAGGTIELSSKRNIKNASKIADELYNRFINGVDFKVSPKS